MNAQQIFVGIDISKAWLDIHILPDGKSRRIANRPAGHRLLVRSLPARRVGRVALEASGGYERAVVAALRGAGLPVDVANPRQVREFARGRGVHAKTDAIDARIRPCSPVRTRAMRPQSSIRPAISCGNM